MALDVAFDHAPRRERRIAVCAPIEQRDTLSVRVTKYNQWQPVQHDGLGLAAEVATCRDDIPARGKIDVHTLIGFLSKLFRHGYRHAISALEPAAFLSFA
jgi:hypothetical protein